MKIKALRSFAGTVSMYEGEVREVGDKYIVDDLLRAGYAEPAAEAVVISKKENTTSKKPAKKKR